MAFIPVPNTVQVELRFTLDEQRIENTLWFLGNGAPTLASANTLALGLKNWWNTGLRNILSNQLSLNEIYITDQSAQDGFVVAYTAGLPILGQNPVAAAPNNCALCVSFRTAARGRTARGRNYIAGLHNSDLVSNSWTTAVANSVVSEYNELIAVAQDAGYLWVVASRYFNNAPRAAGITRQITTAVVVDTVLDSQRRRLPKRGQ